MLRKSSHCIVGSLQIKDQEVLQTKIRNCNCVYSRHLGWEERNYLSFIFDHDLLPRIPDLLPVLVRQLLGLTECHTQKSISYGNWLHNNESLTSFPQCTTPHEEWKTTKITKRNQQVQHLKGYNVTA